MPWKTGDWRPAATSHPAALLLRAVLVAMLATLAGTGRADDVRLAPLKDLGGFFPFTPPASVAAWNERAAEVRRRVLVSQGLWPPPTKTPLNAVIHGTIEIDDPLAPGGGYTVSKVFFESLPGLFVTGNLYRPKAVADKAPGVLFAHGHRQDARLEQQPPADVRQEIASGAERFEQGGRSRYQAMCVQLARMGCVVWHWDMLGHSDSRQLSRELVHGFAKQRPEMNRPDRWGLFSPQAESRLQNVMGLHTWNSIRSLDFLLSLPEVDPDRVAMTGSSGGGTQTMLLAAVDDRLALAYPVVMVSTSMQGGCTCENASLLRIGTGNVEFAALFAPKPQGMNTADDWTRQMATKGFPDLERLYDMLGAKDRVMLFRAEHFPHNYNAVNRSAFYSFVNRQFRLGCTEPVIEHDYEPLSAEQLSVWDASHPAPAAAEAEFERSLLTHLARDVEGQVRAAAATREGIETLLEPAFATLVGRSFATAGAVEWRPDATAGRGPRLTGVLANTTHGEEVPVAWLSPAGGTAPTDWRGEVVVWLDSAGRGAGPDDPPADGLPAEIRDLLAGDTAVVTADLFHAREAALVGETPARQRTVQNPREFAGYTFGYNDPAVVRSVHDVLTILAFFTDAGGAGRPRATRIGVAGRDDAAPVVLLARTVAGAAIDMVTVDTGGFRFAGLDDWRHPLFLPGAVRYLDVPGLVAAGGAPLRLAGETADTLLPISRQAIASGAVSLADAAGGRSGLAAEVSYEHLTDSDSQESGPQSIHVVSFDLARGDLALIATVGAGVRGNETVPDMVAGLPAAAGRPLAAINGDYFEFLGEPRFAGTVQGLCIEDGDLVAAPPATAFWVDPQGQPRLGPVASRLAVVWPDGRETPFAVNCSTSDFRSEVRAVPLVLFTPRFGPTTQTAQGAREWVLRGTTAASQGLHLPVGDVVTARVTDVCESGDAAIPRDGLVLSRAKAAPGTPPDLAAGDTVQLRTTCQPDMTGVRTAIGGAPLVLSGGTLRTNPADANRAPRTAVGLAGSRVWFVVVDGRDPDTAVGMSHHELAVLMQRLGCTDALNLDGGGSATLWYGGRVMNAPSDGGPRPVGNALVLVRRP